VNRANQARDVVAVFGIAALALSAALIAGSFARHVVATNYFEQADEGRPWVQWGTVSALAGFVLAWFNRRMVRIASVIAGLLLTFFWYGAGMSLI
jgi:hypothetical protein